MCFIVPLCIISLVCVSRFVRCFFSTVVCVFLLLMSGFEG